VTSDTTRAARDVQVALLRRAGCGRRLRLVWSLSGSAVRLSKRALRRRHPGWSDEQLGLAFVELSYGRALAARLRAHWGGHE